MKKITQLQWVKNEIMATGEIGRNNCLQNYITRLSALIKDLEKEGYEFTAKFVPYQSIYSWSGKDYIYTATHIPSVDYG